MSEAYKAGWAAYQRFILAAVVCQDEDAMYDDLPSLQQELKRIRDRGISYMTDFEQGWDDAAELACADDLSLA